MFLGHYFILSIHLIRLKGYYIILLNFIFNHLLFDFENINFIIILKSIQIFFV